MQVYQNTILLTQCAIKQTQIVDKKINHTTEYSYRRNVMEDIAEGDYRVSTNRHGAIVYDNATDGYPNHLSQLETTLNSEFIQEQWDKQFADPIRIESDSAESCGNPEFVSVYWKHFGKPSFKLARVDEAGTFAYKESADDSVLWRTCPSLLPVAKYSHADAVLVIGASNAGKSSLCNFLMNPFLNRDLRETPAATSSYWCYASSYLPRTGTTMQIVDIYADAKKEFYDPRYILGPTSRDSILCLLDAPGWADDRFLSSYFGSNDRIPEILGGDGDNKITIDQVHLINTVKGLQDNKVRYVSAIVLVITTDELSDQKRDAESWTKILTQLSTYKNVINSSGCLHIVVTKNQALASQPVLMWSRLTSFLDKLNVLLQVMSMGNVKLYPFIINSHATGDEWFYTVSQAQRLIAQLHLCKSMCKPESIRVYKEPELIDVHLMKCRELIETIEHDITSYTTSLNSIKCVDKDCMSQTSEVSSSRSLTESSRKLLSTDGDSLYDQLELSMSDLKVLADAAVSCIKSFSDCLVPSISTVLFLGVETIPGEDNADGSTNQFRLVVYDTMRRELIDIDDSKINCGDQKSYVVPRDCELVKHSSHRIKVLDNTTDFKQIVITPQSIDVFFSSNEGSENVAARDAAAVLKGGHDSIKKFYEQCARISTFDDSSSDMFKLFCDILDECKTMINAGSKKKERKAILDRMVAIVDNVARNSDACIGPNSTLRTTLRSWNKDGALDMSPLSRSMNSLIGVCRLLENGASGKEIAPKINLPCLGDDPAIMDKRFVDAYTVSALVPCFTKDKVLKVRGEVMTELAKIRQKVKEATHTVRGMANALKDMATTLTRLKKLINEDIHVYLYKAFVDSQKAARVGDIQPTASPAVGDLDIDLRGRQVQETLAFIEANVRNYKDTLSLLRDEYLATNNNMGKMAVLHEKGFILNPMCPPPTVVRSEGIVKVHKDVQFKKALDSWKVTVDIQLDEEEISKPSGGVPPIHKYTYDRVVALREQINALDGGSALIAAISADLRLHVSVVSGIQSRLDEASTACQMMCRSLRDKCESFPDIASATAIEKSVFTAFKDAVKDLLPGGNGEDEDKDKEDGGQREEKKLE